MEMQQTPIKLITGIWENTKGKGFSPQLLEDLHPYLNPLSAYLRVSPVQSFFLALIFIKNSEDEVGSYASIGKHLECTPVTLLEYKNELDQLVENGYLEKKISGSGILKDRFSIARDVTNAIIERTPVPVFQKKEDPHDIFSFIKKDQNEMPNDITLPGNIPYRS